jgi:hypothetical protein
MNWLKLIPDALGLIAAPVKGWVDRKKKQQEHEQLIEEAKVQSTLRRIEKDQDHAIDWDTQNAKNAATSWKDEFWTIVLSIPAILCFVPGCAQYVKEGFDVLRDTPEWYQYALLVAISAAFGWSKLMSWKKGNLN